MAYSTLPQATLSDLLLQLRRFVPSSGRPDYALWLGAGASVSSGISTAGQMVRLFLREAYASHHVGVTKEAIARLSDEELRTWAAQALPKYRQEGSTKSEYARVMESVYPSPEMRSKRLRELIQSAQVSEGYKYLGQLLKKGVFDTIFTTNFDHMIRLGTERYLSQPLVEVNSRDIFQRLEPFASPRVVRLHGDVWHDNFLHTEGELDKTPTVRYNAVKRLLRTYGLIVIGYGGWDMKLMRQLFQPLWKDPHILTKGLYWCHRPGDTLSPQVHTLLEKAPPGRAFLVEITDFDAVMAQFASHFALDFAPEKDWESERRAAWDAQALISQCVLQLLAENTLTLSALLARSQELLHLLCRILGGAQALCICYHPATASGNMVAGSGLGIGWTSLPSWDPHLGTFLLENKSDYIHLEPTHPRAESPLFSLFAPNTEREIYPVWLQDELHGMLVFASERLLDQSVHSTLIKTIARLIIGLLPNVPSVATVLPLRVQPARKDIEITRLNMTILLTRTHLGDLERIISALGATNYITKERDHNTKVADLVEFAFRGRRESELYGFSKTLLPNWNDLVQIVESELLYGTKTEI